MSATTDPLFKMVEDKAVFQLQLRIAEGHVRAQPNDFACSCCGNVAPNRCQQCDTILLPSHRMFPGHPTGILTPDNGWINVQPTFSGMHALPGDKPKNLMSPGDRAKIAFERYKYTEMMELIQKDVRPRVRLVAYEFDQVMVESDRDHGVPMTRSKRRPVTSQ